MKHSLYTQLSVISLIVGLLLAGQTLSAQGAPSFLDIGMDSRTAAMGGSQLAGTAMTLFTNPAGLGSIHQFQATTTVTDWLLDIRHLSGAVALPVDGVGTFGLSTVWMDYGTFERTAPARGSASGFTTDGTFDVAEYAVGLAYARPLTSQIQVGGQLQLVGQHFPGWSADGEATSSRGQHRFVWEFGTMYAPGWHDLQVGLTAVNGSQHQDGAAVQSLSVHSSIGIAVDALSFLSNVPNHSLMAVYDWEQLPDAGSLHHVGAEYRFHQLFFLRSGYRLGADLPELTTAGIGFHLPVQGIQVQADYAFEDYGEVFQAVHRFTVGVRGR